jgi:quinol monooxygenase YgiN
LDILQILRMVILQMTTGKAIFIVTVLASLVLIPAPQAQADQSSPPAALQRVVIITHIDAMPSFTEQAVSLLRKYRQDAMADSGAEKIEILQQAGRPNHFTVVEEWNNQPDYDRHVSAAHTIQFRQQLAPMLGAPFDERPHSVIE